jgi:hypothetical protein
LFFRALLACYLRIDHNLRSEKASTNY